VKSHPDNRTVCKKWEGLPAFVRKIGRKGKILYIFVKGIDKNGKLYYNTNVRKRTEKGRCGNGK
jgi:hypothetical protein